MSRPKRNDSTMEVVIRRNGTLIDVSPDGRAPLPQPLVELLTPHMSYDYKQLLYGAAAYDQATGSRDRVQLERRQLYRMEEGRLATCSGYIPRITSLLSAAGHTVRYLDLSPPRRRPTCYDADWANLYRYIKPHDPSNPRRPGHFRARQEECLESIAGSEGSITDAAPGFGKTFLFKALCMLYPTANIAIVVKPKDVAARIVRQLTEHFPSVGQVGGGKNHIGRITVYTAGSMHHCDGDVDFLFADETHQLMSPDHSQALGSAFRQTRNFAFTATPEGRLDGADAKMEMFFGPIGFRLSYPEAVELGLVVPIRVRWLPIQMNHNPANGLSAVPRMRMGIWRNDARNQAIAADATSHYGGDEQVLMLCATVDHAIHLWQYLPDYELCYSNMDPRKYERYRRLDMLPEGYTPMTPERRERLREGFETGAVKKVIATDVWSTGVDFEQLQALYRLDARGSEILDYQGPCRACRMYDGKEFAEVIDCIDQFDKTLKRKSVGRRRNYDKRGWTQDWPVGTRQVSHV